MRLRESCHAFFWSRAVLVWSVDRAPPQEWTLTHLTCHRFFYLCNTSKTQITSIAAFCPLFSEIRSRLKVFGCSPRENAPWWIRYLRLQVDIKCASKCSSNSACSANVVRSVCVDNVKYKNIHLFNLGTHYLIYNTRLSTLKCFLKTKVPEKMKTRHFIWWHTEWVTHSNKWTSLYKFLLNI